MIPRRHLASVAVALSAASALGGCVSLLPKQTPVQLYAFGRGAAPPSATAQAQSVRIGPGGAVLGVSLGQVAFPRSALGDGILTTRGNEAAYVAGARWLGPAVVLFQEATERAFDDRGRAVRLLDRGQLGAASAILRLDVGEFDARYDPASASPPTVVVDYRATLASPDGRRLAERRFTVSRPAGEDRVSAIVAAYDAAVAQSLAELVDWTEATAPGLAATPTPAGAGEGTP